VISKKRAAFGRFPIWLAVGVVVAVVGAVCFAQGAPASRPASAPAAADVPKLTMWDLLVRGGWLMYPIALASLMGLSIIFERLLALRRRKAVPPGFLDLLKNAYRQDIDDIQKGIDYCTANDCPIARMLAVGLRHLDRDDVTVERAIEDVGLNEVTKLRRNLRLLFGVAAVSPMLGLLGSVSGMIQSFHVASIIGVGKAELLAKGIYEALVATYGGLAVAIPTLIFYYAFLNKIDSIVTDMNDVSRKFLEHYRTADPAP